MDVRLVSMTSSTGRRVRVSGEYHTCTRRETTREKKQAGGVLLSQGVSAQVPSALKGLTAGFGMGPGVSPSP